MLDFDDEENAGFALYWCRRYETFVDSALHDSPTDLLGREVGADYNISQDSSSDMTDTLSISTRPPTPHPVMAARTESPALNSVQNTYWGQTQEMPTACRTLFQTRLVNTADARALEREMESEFVMEDPFRDVHLGDSLSPSNRKKITELMSNLYQPDSPEGTENLGGNIEKIIPAKHNSKPDNKVSSRRSELSPHAAPFVPAQPQNEVMDMDISDSTIRDGANAMVDAINGAILEVGDLMNTITDEEWDLPDPNLRSCLGPLCNCGVDCLCLCQACSDCLVCEDCSSSCKAAEKDRRRAEKNKNKKSTISTRDPFNYRKRKTQ